MLLAVIFSFDSAPDSRMDKESLESQNNSAVFSRISAIFGAGDPPCGIVSDGETGREKCMFRIVDRGNSRSRKTALFLLSLTPAYLNGDLPPNRCY